MLAKWTQLLTALAAVALALPYGQASPLSPPLTGHKEET
jgi:hypothetical protein